MTTQDQALIVSKFDVARRQLETAITLYFHHGDPVSIHALVAAGHQVLSDVNTKRGGQRMVLKDTALDHVKPEMRGPFLALVNKAENFFKHADRDHDATLEFWPRSSEILAYEACTKYWELTGEPPCCFRLTEDGSSSPMLTFSTFPWSCKGRRRRHPFSRTMVALRT